MKLSKCTQKQLHTHKLGSVDAHRTEGVTGSERREGAYGVGGRIRVGGVNGDGNGVGGESGDGDSDGERNGAETRSVMEASEETQDGQEGGNPWTTKGWERGREAGRKREHVRR